MPDTLEAPTNPSDVAEAASVFQSVKSFDSHVSEAAPQKEAQTQAKTGETTNAEGQTLTDKPDPTKDGAPKSRLEKLSGVKKPEPKKEEQKPNGQAETQPEKPVDTANMRQLREAYNKSKENEAALREELEKVRPDAAKVEEYRKELDMSREELAKLKAMNLNEEERGEYTKLRDMHALSVLRESKDFKEKIMAPIQAQGKRLQNVAKQAKLDPVGVQALENAMDMTDELDRKREIRRIFKAIPDLSPEDFTDFYTESVSIGDKLNNDLYPALDAKEKQAMEIEQAARTKGKEEEEKKSLQEKEEFQKERKFVQQLLKDDKLKVLFEDTDLSVDGTTMNEAMEQIEAADNPRDRAYEVLSGAAMPFMIEKLNRLLSKVHELEEANRVRNGSGPKRGDSLEKGPDTGKNYDPNAANSIFRVPGGFGA